MFNRIFYRLTGFYTLNAAFRSGFKRRPPGKYSPKRWSKHASFPCMCDMGVLIHSRPLQAISHKWRDNPCTPQKPLQWDTLDNQHELPDNIDSR